MEIRYVQIQSENGNYNMNLVKKIRKRFLCMHSQLTSNQLFFAHAGQIYFWGANWRFPLKPLDTILTWCSKRFKGLSIGPPLCREASSFQVTDVNFPNLVIRPQLKFCPRLSSLNLMVPYARDLICHLIEIRASIDTGSLWARLRVKFTLFPFHASNLLDSGINWFLLFFCFYHSSGLQSLQRPHHTSHRTPCCYWRDLNFFDTRTSREYKIIIMSPHADFDQQA